MSVYTLDFIRKQLTLFIITGPKTYGAVSASLLLGSSAQTPMLYFTMAKALSGNQRVTQGPYISGNSYPKTAYSQSMIVFN